MDNLSLVIGILVIVALLFVSFLSLLTVIARWKMFSKAGLKGWYSLIPIYNIYNTFKLAYGSNDCLLKFFLLLVPIVNIYISFEFNVKLFKCFDKDLWYAVTSIFFGPIPYLLIAFGKCEYVGPLLDEFYYQEDGYSYEEQTKVGFIDVLKFWLLYNATYTIVTASVMIVVAVYAIYFLALMNM